MFRFFLVSARVLNSRSFRVGLLLLLSLDGCVDEASELVLRRGEYAMMRCFSTTSGSR